MHWNIPSECHHQRLKSICGGVRCVWINKARCSIPLIFDFVIEPWLKWLMVTRCWSPGQSAAEYKLPRRSQGTVRVSCCVPVLLKCRWIVMQPLCIPVSPLNCSSRWLGKICSVVAGEEGDWLPSISNSDRVIVVKLFNICGRKGTRIFEGGLSGRIYQ